ncbi:MAG: hypothetical protein R3296_07090 [Oleiphilaceae bacterium]|nr:hypothetical protein [Oleiphilaceae bacterium]
MAEKPAQDDENTADNAGKKALLTKGQWLLFGGLLLALILLSVAITFLLSSPSSQKDNPEVASELRVQVETLEQRMSAYEDRLSELNKALVEVQTTPAGESLSPALLKQLKQQERSTQELITVIKEGIGDLSRMIPGSRDWLELYSEQLEEVRAQSKLRLEMLETLETDGPQPSE